jgi:membrane dipeptidase
VTADVSRRTALGLAAAAAATAAVRAQTPGYSEADYAAAMVIDAQGVPAFINDPSEAATAAKSLAASGVTAMSVTVGTVGNGPNRFDSVVSDIADLNELIDGFPAQIARIRGADDLRAAKAGGLFGIILNTQDTSALEGDISRVERLKGLGLRIIQLTYNKRGLGGDGCMETVDGGVSDFGRKVIAEVEKQKLLLDLAHAGPRTVAEGVAAATRPMAISHTGCRDLCNNPRNVYDATLRAMADKGGVVGIYFMNYLASGIGDKPREATPEDVIRHLEHAVKVCGEDHVGIGTDGTVLARPYGDQAARDAARKHYEMRVHAGISSPGDGPDITNIIPEYNGPKYLMTVGRDLARRGWPTSRIEKILGGNFARLFADAWGA